MSKKITNMSSEYQAITVPAKEDNIRKVISIAPGESETLNDEQAASESVQELVSQGILTVSDNVIENVSGAIRSFPVPGREYAVKKQVIMAPGASATITDEQAASEGMKKVIDSGMVDDPDDEFGIRGASGKIYKTIAAAIAGGEKSIKLLSDFSGSATISAGKSLLIDLNGCAISNRSTPLANKGKLEIRDSKGGGSITCTGNYAIGCFDNSTTTVGMGKGDGFTVTGQEGAFGVVAANAKLSVKGGKFVGLDNAVVLMNGSQQYGGNVINIDGGEFEGHIQSAGYVACGIYCPNDDEVTVNGGRFTIDGGCGICSRAGKVTVNGGEFKTTGNVTGMVGDSRVVVPCAALVFDTDAKYPKLSADDNITVNGGKFKSDVPCVANVGEERITVNGGQFDPAL